MQNGVALKGEQLLLAAREPAHVDGVCGVDKCSRHLTATDISGKTCIKASELAPA